MASSAQEENIIERARNYKNTQHWLILAGDLEKFVANVLFHTVEEIINDLCKELQLSFNIASHIDGLFVSAGKLKSKAKRYLANAENCKKIKESPIELAKLFCSYPLQYHEFSEMDVSCLLQIIVNCTLFNEINRDAITNVREYRNKVMHNKFKVVEKNVFDQAFVDAKRLLKDQFIESRWKKYEPNRPSIESQLENIQNKTSNIDINKSSILAVENNLTYIFCECEHISTVQKEIVDELDDIIDLFIKLVDKQSVEVTDNDDIIDNTSFRIVHKQKLELIKASISSLRSNVNNLESENLEIKEEMKNLKSQLESGNTEIQEIKNLNSQLKCENSKIKEEIKNLKSQVQSETLEIKEMKNLKSQIEYLCLFAVTLFTMNCKLEHELYISKFDLKRVKERVMNLEKEKIIKLDNEIEEEQRKEIEAIRAAQEANERRLKKEQKRAQLSRVYEQLSINDNVESDSGFSSVSCLRSLPAPGQLARGIREGETPLRNQLLSMNNSFFGNDSQQPRDDRVIDVRRSDHESADGSENGNTTHKS